MKNKRNSVLAIIKTATILIATLVTIYSCRSTDVEGNLTPGLKASIDVSIEDIIFESSNDIENKASANPSQTISEPTVQKNTIALNKDFYLVAELTQELTPIAVAKKEVKAAQKQASNTALTTNLDPNIRYKILVYNNSGLYVTEKDYIRGQETTQGALLLDGGQNYTFIVYSVNSTTTLPTVIFSNPANKTLTTSSVAVTGTQDFMYFRKDMTVSGSNTNYLGVVLKHKFSQITTTIDASQTGYNVTAITSSINPQHRPNASIALSDGTITRSGTATTVNVTFPTLGTQIITAAPNIINAATSNTGSYTIASLTVGPLNATGITPFTNLNITPGSKYNMKLTIVPSDVNLTYLGVNAVRIGGQIWMRHNLGANTSLNPDAPNGSGSLQQLFGNYYQWGSSAVAATSNSGASAPVSPWNTTAVASATAWNSGTEAAPLKTTADPCPTGWRVPTTTEWNILKTNTTQLQADNIGTDWTSSNTKYTSAKVVRSKRNYNVKLTFPAAGDYIPNTDRTLENRGALGFYWSSQSSSSTLAYRNIFSQPDNGAETGVGENNKPYAFSIRCIQE